MAQKVFIHVGLPKAGSSTLQRRLNDNREALFKQGYFHPEPDFNTMMPKHQYLVLGLLSGDNGRLLADLEAANRRDVIVTTEGLTNHLYDFPESSVANFRDMLSGKTVICLLVTRDAQSWSRSYYKQAVINPRVGIPGVSFYATDLPLRDFRQLPRIRALTDTGRLKSDLEEKYGAAEVHEIKLADSWMNTVDHIIGLDAEGWRIPPKENESPPDACIEILRQVNAYDLPEEQRVQWKAALQMFFDTNHTALKAIRKNAGPIALDTGIVAQLRPNQDPDMVLDAPTLDAFVRFAQEL